MNRNTSAGFTLIEVLVASILLGMLVTILTMVFNSSSIAWRTGRAGVAEMDAVRTDVSDAHIAADNALPLVDPGNSSDWGVLVSPWKPDGTLRDRAVEKMSENTFGADVWTKLDVPKINANSGVGKGIKLWVEFDAGQIRSGKGAKSFVVGVMSQGPDVKKTKDDISTWPDVN